MKIQEITNSQNFEGKLVIINNLSSKPTRCVKKVKNSIDKIIRPKDFNLNIRQDYSNQEVIFTASYPFPIKPHQRIFMRLDGSLVRISSNSKSSKYIKAAENAIDLFEKNINRSGQLELQYQKEDQKQLMIKNTKNFAFDIFIGYPLSLIELIAEAIHPKLGEKVGKFVDKAFDCV